MSVIRPRPPDDPIEYAAGVPSADDAVARQRRDAVARARAELSDRADTILPDRLLEDYNTGGGRAASEVFAILQAARRIRDAVDRVIVLGDDGDILAARSIFESCGHPFHNELSRGERGGRPRLTFLRPPFDGDVLAGVLDLVAPPGRPRSGDLLEQWGIIVVGRGDAAAESAAVARLLLTVLAETLAHDRAEMDRRVVMITDAVGSPADPITNPARAHGPAFAVTADPRSTLTAPAGRGFGAALTAPGLLTAAVAGIDVVRLLQGAAAMNRRFREAPAAENPVLRYVGASPWIAGQGWGNRLLVSRSRQLDAVCRWHGDRAVSGAAALTTELVVREPRRDPLGRQLPGEQAGTTAAGPRAATVRPGPPADAILLPRIDEHALGQLLQFLHLAALVGAAAGEAV